MLAKCPPALRCPALILAEGGYQMVNRSTDRLHGAAHPLLRGGMTVKLAMFDCDGTLVDSQANICRAAEQAFSGLGLEAPPRERVRGIIQEQRQMQRLLADLRRDTYVSVQL